MIVCIGTVMIDKSVKKDGRGGSWRKKILSGMDERSMHSMSQQAKHGAGEVTYFK